MMQPNKVIIITGASRGLGKYLKEKLCQKGYTILAIARTEIPEEEGVLSLAMDVSVANERASLISFIRKNKLDVYGLINNAATGAMNQIMTTPQHKIEEVMSVNYLATSALCRDISKLMIGNKSGRIINIGTQTLALKTPLEAAYASSKAAVETFTKILAKEIACYNITANIVSPAVMDTQLIKGISKERLQYMLDQQAIKKEVTFDDVSNVVEFLLEERSANITGQNIYLGGVIV